eukprot:GHVN01013338.1.p2 GENE.GHVN01013338.1~~GHVN01013338.1.p2  ORF type:complete len:466 (+),score=101.76 GHVN01013338.1:2013-3410(+)
MLGSLYGDLPPESTSSTEGAPNTTAQSQNEHSETDTQGNVGVGKSQNERNQNKKVTRAIGGNTSSGVSATSWTARPSLLVPSTIRAKREVEAALADISTHVTADAGTPKSPTTSTATATAQPHSILPPPPFALGGAQSSKSFLPVSVLRESGTLPKESSALAPTAVIHEYDPSNPNSYDQVLQQRKKQKHIEMQNQLERQKREEADRLMREQMETIAPLNRTPTPGSNIGPAAKVPLNISGDEAWRRRGELASSSSSMQPPAAASIDVEPSTGAGSEMGGEPTGVPGGKPKKNVAEAMMQRMGWKLGEGLGRDKQGIVAPLIAKKTDRRSGVIVEGKRQPVPKAASAVDTPTAPAVVGTTFNTNPTRVILLKNLVGPGEVDDDLKAETQEEASRFGNLLSVEIYEAKGKKDDESVRIFCEYESKEHATKALVALNGRYFGWRVVNATFFDPDRYKAKELAPRAGE